MLYKFKILLVLFMMIYKNLYRDKVLWMFYYVCMNVCMLIMLFFK